MKTNTEIEMAYNGNIFTGLKQLWPQLNSTERRHVLLNTIWITLLFAIMLALLLYTIL